MKDIIKNILIEFHKDDLPSLFRRSQTIPILPKNIRKVLVFVGMRRVGKTYLMYQHMHDLLSQGLAKEKLLYINFEDDRLEGFSVHDFQSILDAYFELYPSYTEADDLIFYFDEIQNIEGWEKFIRRLIDKERMRIFITGSSAKSLSKEIATNLRGRSLETEVFPLGFTEYLHYRGITDFNRLTSKEKSIITHHCQTYLKRGGFPETLPLSDSLHHQIIQSYVNTAVFRDVIDRHKLQAPHVVRLFLIHCLQNIAAPLSITKVHKTLKSRGESLSRNSLYEYLSYFEDAYLIFNVPIFDLSTRKRQVNPSKIYCVDPGIITGYSIKPHTEQGPSLENAVYIHLKKLGFESIYYHKTRTGKEVDFVAQNTLGKLALYQACIDLRDEDTKNREVNALIEAAEELQIHDAYIITHDRAETIQLPNLTIHSIPYWQWVLDTENQTKSR